MQARLKTRARPKAREMPKTALEGSPDPGWTSRSVFDLDGNYDGTCSRRRNLVQIGWVLDLIAAHSVNDVVNGKTRRHPEVNTERIDQTLTLLCSTK